MKKYKVVIPPFKKKMDLNIADVVKILPVFNGEHRELENFLNLVKLIHDTLKQVEKEKLITLILAVKISDTVRSKIALEDKLITFDQLKICFERIFISRRTALEIQSEICRIRQTGKIECYIAQIESLVTELNLVQKRSLQDADCKTIYKISDQIGLNAFKEGLIEKLKPTVIASRPKTLSQAIEIARDASKILETDTNMVSHLRNLNNQQAQSNNRNFRFRGNNRNLHNSMNSRPPFYNNFRAYNARNYSNNNYRGNFRYSNPSGNFINNINQHQQNRYNMRNQNIRVLQHSGNEMAPPTTTQEEITAQMDEMSIK